MLGEHTRSSLEQWLSLGQSAIDLLVEAGVIFDGSRR